MRTRRTLGLAAAAMTAMLAGCSGGGGSNDTGLTYYLSLGDSAAAGFQPTRGARATSHGYADQLFGLLRSRIGGLRLVKMGCAGETAESLISGHGSPCPSASGSQLDRAGSFLEKHRGHVAFITITIGANDVIGPCLDNDTGRVPLACVRAGMPDVESNLGHILQTLRSAAPGVPIAGMSYWDPLLGAWISGAGGHSLARTDEKSFQAMNAGLVSTYRDQGALVADVAGPASFDISNFTDTVVTKKWGKLPLNVANACTWTWFCAPPPLGMDFHPNTEGYGVIAKAFRTVLSPHL